VRKCGLVQVNQLFDLENREGEVEGWEKLGRDERYFSPTLKLA
jgi:hypothetical protein